MEMIQKSLSSDNSQVWFYVTLLASRDIIPFEKHITTVGTTSNNMLSKRKTLDEGSDVNLTGQNV